MADQTISVGDFVGLARQCLKNEPLLSNTAIRGEVKQLTIARSGHVYFTLRDPNGQLDCVMFNSASKFSGIKEGQEIIALGSIDVYPPQGKMQFRATKIEPVEKIGQMEKIKRELIEKWRLDGTMERVRTPIPLFPRRLHIITGAGSAALSDMQRLIENRWPNLHYTIIPVLVQGEKAPEEIVKAISMAGKRADLIIVGRGGGSPEDLWAFNLESVCQAIIDCPAPVVSAVGHESDLLVSDLIADLRASTPSNAIERVIPILAELQGAIDLANDRLQGSIDRWLLRQIESIKLLSSRLSAGPMRGLSKEKVRIQSLISRINRSTDNYLNTQKTKLNSFEMLLTATNPERVLHRGYSMALTPEGKVVSSAKGLKEGDSLTVVLKDGRVHTEVKK